MRKIRYNSPVVLTFALASLAALLLGMLTGGVTNRLLFSVYRTPLTDPLGYVRLFFHVLGHADWSHYSGNILLMLVIGPQLEERYGSHSLLYAIAVTALITGVAQCLLFPGTAVLGASGIVFMMILLASMSGTRGGGIPLTALLVAIFYLGSELISAITVRDTVSQLSHILGGLCGAGIGFAFRRR